MQVSSTGGIRLGGGVDLAVDADQFGDRIGVERGGVEQGFPAVEDHPELGAPVADVVVGDDREAEEAGDAAERVADDGRADVADVHRLGHVGRGEIDHHGLAVAEVGHAEVVVVEQGGGAGGVGGGQDAEIDEPGAGDVGGGEAVEFEVVDDFLGQRARVGLARFGEHHRGVRLIVAEAQVGGGGHGGGGGFAEGGGEGGGEAGFEILEERHGG